MTSPYIIYSKRSGYDGQKAITFSRDGRLTCNVGLSDLLDCLGITHILMGYDPLTKRVALIGSPHKERDTYKLTVADSKRRRKFISVKGFLESIGFRFGETRSYTVTWNQELKLLEFQLKETDFHPPKEEPNP